MIGYTKNAGCPNKILKTCRVPKKKRMEFLGTLRFLWVFADLGFCFPRSGSGTLKNFGFLGTLGIFWFFLVFFGFFWAPCTGSPFSRKTRTKPIFSRKTLHGKPFFEEKHARNPIIRGKPCTGSPSSKKNPHKTKCFEENPRLKAFYHSLQLEMRPSKPNQAKNKHNMHGA